MNRHARDQSDCNKEQIMTVFYSIDGDNNIAVHPNKDAAIKEAGAAGTTFATEEQLSEATALWPASRLVEVWNGFAGAPPFAELKEIKKFTDRKSAAMRIWNAVQRLASALEQEKPVEVAPTPAPAKQEKLAKAAKPAKVSRTAAPKAPAKPKATKETTKKDAAAAPKQREGTRMGVFDRPPVPLRIQLPSVSTRLADPDSPHAQVPDLWRSSRCQRSFGLRLSPMAQIAKRLHVLDAQPLVRILLDGYDVISVQVPFAQRERLAQLLEHHLTLWHAHAAFSELFDYRWLPATLAAAPLIARKAENAQFPMLLAIAPISRRATSRLALLAACSAVAAAHLADSAATGSCTGACW
jgi:hypothetical protein